MDYGAIYGRLVARARTREIIGYAERHHVVPRCMGGDNSKDNIVLLTAAEHYVAHQLLVKMFPGNRKILYAALSMTRRSGLHSGRSSKLYGWLRQKMADETRRRSAGRVVSAETRRKMSEAAKKKTLSESHKAAISAALKGRRYGPRSPEVIERCAVANRVVQANRDNAPWQTPEFRAHQSQKMKSIWAERKTANRHKESSK